MVQYSCEDPVVIHVRWVFAYMNLFEAIDTYIDHRGLEKTVATMKGEQIDLRLLCLYLKNPRFSTITSEQIVHYLRTLIQYGWTQHGVYKKAIVFRSFWKFANQKVWDTFNYALIPIIKTEAKMPKSSTQSQYEKVMSAIPEHPYYHIRNKAFIALLRHSGMRCGEAVLMDIDKNLDLKNKTTIIRTEKSRGLRPFRQVFWNDETAKLLDEWLKIRKEFAEEGPLEDENALWVGFSSIGFGKRLKAHSACIFLRKYSLMAKVSPTVNPHSLRHLFAHDLVKAGGNNSDIMNLLGHAKMESSRVYTLMHGEELHERYMKLKVKKDYPYDDD